MPTSRRAPIFTFIFIVLILVAIWYAITQSDLLDSISEEPPVPETAVNIVTPAPAPISISNLDILYADSFDQSAGSWELSPASQAVYRDGFIFLQDSNMTDFGWARPHLRFQNFVLEIDNYWVGGAVGGTSGIRFRLRDSGEFLAIQLKNDGWFAIIQGSADSQRILHEAFGPTIDRSGGLNRIHIEAYGEQYRFFVNDGYLADIQISSPESGDIMLIAQKAVGTDDFSVAFDNLNIALAP